MSTWRTAAAAVVRPIWEHSHTSRRVPGRRTAMRRPQVQELQHANTEMQLQISSFKRGEAYMQQRQV
jgi:hypothetical protein